MSLTQWILILVPALAAYLWFVFNAESGGRVRPSVNALAGLVVIPLATVFIPAIAVQMAAGGWRKRHYGVVAGALAALLVFIAYGVVVYALGRQAGPATSEPSLER